MAISYFISGYAQNISNVIWIAKTEVVYERIFMEVSLSSFPVYGVQNGQVLLFNTCIMYSGDL